jgi:hypothetical protein
VKDMCTHLPLPSRRPRENKHHQLGQPGMYGRSTIHHATHTGTVCHWRIHRRGSGINLVFRQDRRMLADLELRADILQ